MLANLSLAKEEEGYIVISLVPARKYVAFENLQIGLSAAMEYESKFRNTVLNLDVIRHRGCERTFPRLESSKTSFRALH